MALEVIRSKKRYQSGPRKTWEFILEFYRGNDPVPHEFKAYPSMDAGGLSYTLSATHKPERAIEGMVRSIRKALADDDGTPANYRPTRYAPPRSDDETDDETPKDRPFDPFDDEPTPPLRRIVDAVAATETSDADLDDADLDDPDLLFTGPDGEPIDGAGVNELLKFERGSSRRRFAYLMDEDEELVLDLEQLQMVYKKLLAQVADRPTRR